MPVLTSPQIYEPHYCKYQLQLWLHWAKPAEQKGKGRWIERSWRVSGISQYKVHLSEAAEDKEHSIFYPWLNVWELDCVNNIGLGVWTHTYTSMFKQRYEAHCHVYAAHLRAVTNISEHTCLSHYCSSFRHNCAFKLSTVEGERERERERERDREAYEEKKMKLHLNGFGLLTRVEKNAFPLYIKKAKNKTRVHTNPDTQSSTC